MDANYLLSFCSEPHAIPLASFERQRSGVMKKLRDNVANMELESQDKDVNGNYTSKDLEQRHSKLRNTMAVKNFGMNEFYDCMSPWFVNHLY